MPISTRLRTTRSVLARTPAYSMIKADEVDGELILVETVTGRTFRGADAFRNALAYVDVLRIADHREIDPTGVFSQGKMTGAQVNADRVVRLNNYLSDPTNRASLASIGLEDLSGGSVSGRMILFDTQNQKSALETISRTIETSVPGEVAVTDGGIQLFSLSQAVTSAGESIVLSRAQQEALKQLSGINIFKQDSVADFFGFAGEALSASTPEEAANALGRVGKMVGKITKRYQSTFSARDVSSGRNIIEQLISEGTIAAAPQDYNFRYSYIEAMLKTAAGGYDLLSDEEKVLISGTIEAADSIDIGLSIGLPTADLSEGIFVPRESGSAAEQALRIIQEQLQLRVFDPSGVESTSIPSAFVDRSNEITELIQEALHEQQTSIAAGDPPRRLVDIISDLSEHSPPEVKNLVEKLEESMETAVDGHYLLLEKSQRRILEMKKDHLHALRLGTIDDITLSKINQLQNEIESIEAAIESGDRNPTRVGIPGEGVLKGEASIIDGQRGLLRASDRDFESLLEIRDNYQAILSSGADLTDEEEAALKYAEMMLRLKESFDSMLTVSDISATKDDIITADPFIAQNIAKSKSGGVFVEDMLLLNDPDFIHNPQRMRRIQAMIDAEKRVAEEFMRTGKIPRQIMDSLRKSASEDLSAMTPSARALAIINRKQALEIATALRQGVDPRNIPALVNMIAKHHISQAFSVEDGKVAVRIPDAFRYKLATITSAAAPFPGLSTDAFSSTIIRDASGKALQIPMVNFGIIGKHAIIADSVASTFKAALGTFDLDDSGLPVLGTYKDHKGRTRIAAVTMRDPKGIQESILMRPQLAHAETLRAMLSDDSDLIESQVKTASSMEIDSLVTRVQNSASIAESDAEEIVQLTLELMKPEQDMTMSQRVIQSRLMDIQSRLGEDSDVALETVVRILREGMYGEKLAVQTSEIAPINQRFLEILGERRSAAIRGRDVLDPISGLPLGPFSNLTAEQGAPYAYKHLIELQLQDDAVSTEGMEKARSSLLDSLGIRPESLPPDQMRTLFATDTAGDALRASLGVNYTQVMAAGEKGFLNYAAAVSGEKIDDIQNSIGLTMNRMASANFLAPQIVDFESTLRGLAASRLGPALTTSLLSDENNYKYGIGTRSPSDIVDLINQMSGTARVTSLADIAQKISDTRGIGLDQAKQTPEYLRTEAAYKTLVKFVDGTGVSESNLHEFSISPSVIARASLEQQGRILGKQRAMGIALGVAGEDLPGFDPLILDTRLGVKDDILNLRNSIVDEYRGVLDELRRGGATGVDLAALENEMEQLRTADLDTIRRILSLSQKGVDKYGSLTNARRLGTAGMAELEALLPRGTRSTISELKAVSDSRYAKESRAFLRTKKIKTLFENIKKLDDANAEKPTRLISTQLRQMKGELGEELSKGIMTLEEIHRGSGANVLDIVETLEAEMNNLYGARRYLMYPGHEGHEDLMVQLQGLSQSRRNLRLIGFDPTGRQILSGHYDTFKTMFRINHDALAAIGDVPDDLMEITAQQARKILEYNEDRIKDGTLRLLTPGITSDQHVLDYLRLVSKTNPVTSLPVEEKETASRIAVEAHAERTRILAEREIEEKTLELTRRMRSAVSLDPEEAARISSDISEGVSTTVGEVFDVAPSPYRRISQMLRDNTSSLRTLIDSRGFKQFAIGTAALVAGSFIYQNKKQKDHTQDSVTGPPLMPGGNPYEQNYPSLQTAQQDFSFNNPTVSGMQYRVNTSGSLQDLNRLRGLFGDVIDGPIDATMYNGLPMAGQDPYPDLASRF